jgi:hypothetical protein
MEKRLEKSLETAIKRRLSRRGFIVQAGVLASSLMLGRVVTAQGQAKLALELLVNFEILNPGSGGRYNKPYVAVWLEDASGKTVRTLSLWVETGRGSRWIPDLKRWYTDQAQGAPDLIATTSGATRPPGTYSLVWDGRNDKKAQLEQGAYYLCIETAREHGPYTLIREKLTLGASAFKQALQGNEEVANASVQFRKPA